jgi:cellulose synthase/poly-beta-1,6-N-acetylglucosamine synthase-like glycosyltransferase
MTSQKPAMSVVVCVHNAMKTVRKCLESLTTLEYPSYEIIVVDDGSTDGSAEICESYNGVRVIRLDKGGPSRARNVGAVKAKGELIAFTDSDCIVDKRWLIELERGFADPIIAGVGGTQVSPMDETEFGKRVQEIIKAIGFMTSYMNSSNTIKEIEHNPSCNSAYRKSVLKEVGGFHEGMWPGEDVDLDLRIRRKGYRLIYNPSAVVGHYRPGTYRDFAKMMRRYGASARHLFAAYGFFRKLHYEPFLLLLALIVVAGVLLWAPKTWPILVVPWVMILLWLCLKTRELPRAVHLTVLFIIALASWNLGFFCGGFWRLQKKSIISE